MRKIFGYLFILLCFMALPSVCSAKYFETASCDYVRKAELSRIASNVQLSYNYEIVGSIPRFYVNISNVTSDIYVEDETYGNVIDKDGVVTYDYSGVTIKYNIYSNDDNCKGEKILTKYVTLPGYNAFSKFYKCDKYPEFKYCQVWLDTRGLTQEDFDSYFNNYVNEKENALHSKSFLEIIKEFALSNIVWIVLTIICFILLVVLIHIRRRRML